MFFGGKTKLFWVIEMSSIGPRYSLNKSKYKISGADMLTGVLLSISYERCPVDPAIYSFDYTSNFCSIDWDSFGYLIDAVAEKTNKEFKPLTFGSAKQYCSAMRKGYRANKNGLLPPLNVTLSQENMTIKIPKRSYFLDLKNYSEAFESGSLSWILDF